MPNGDATPMPLITIRGFIVGISYVTDDLVRARVCLGRRHAVRRLAGAVDLVVCDRTGPFAAMVRLAASARQCRALHALRGASQRLRTRQHQATHSRHPEATGAIGVRLDREPAAHRGLSVVAT